MGYRKDFIFGELIKSFDLNTNFNVIENWEVIGEDLTSQINGIDKTTFSLSYPFVSGTLKVYIDGIRRRPLIGGEGAYTESPPNEIIIDGILQIGQDLVVDYRRSDIL